MIRWDVASVDLMKPNNIMDSGPRSIASRRLLPGPLAERRIPAPEPAETTRIRYAITGTRIAAAGAGMPGKIGWK